MTSTFYNEDCITGATKHLPDNSIDLIITDPPYGIDGDKLHKHYNRNESHVLPGYVEVEPAEYADFSNRWIEQAARALKPGGSIYIISGYTNLIHLLNALAKTSLREVNHIIWKYNFGVYTRNKFVSSHYHILYYTKPGAKKVFNTYSRYANFEKTLEGGSKNYQDREDVWVINREYKPNKIKNKNELPWPLLTKIIQYSSNEGDLICDFFLGSFSTAKVAKGLNRKTAGFELSKTAFNYHIGEYNKLENGFLLSQIETPPKNIYENQGTRISQKEKKSVQADFAELSQKGLTKKSIIEVLSQKYARGYWSISNIIADSPNQQ